MYTLRSDVHPRNTAPPLPPKSSRPSGSTAVVSAVQFLNALYPISVSELLNVTPASPVQPSNALPPMLVTLFGITTVFSAVLSSNALSPITVTVLPPMVPGMDRFDALP